MSDIVVTALYRFVQLDNYQELRHPLLNMMLKNHVRGTLLLAPEGINGTIAGSQKAIDNVIAWLRLDPRLAPVDCKFSYDEEMPFYRSRVKLISRLDSTSPLSCLSSLVWRPGPRISDLVRYPPLGVSSVVLLRRSARLGFAGRSSCGGLPPCPLDVPDCSSGVIEV